MFPRSALFFALLCAAFAPCRADNVLDTIGVTALRKLDPTLTGAGVIVAQVESGRNPLDFEVNPATTGQPVALFSYRSTKGGATIFPNPVGNESGHADQVGQNLYGRNTGAAPGLLHVSLLETNFFLQGLPGLAARVINQSFESGSHDAGEDQRYDNYVVAHHAVIISGAGNGGAVLSPSDCYNGIGVGANGGATSTGPTADGRCKPDLTAPAVATSFSTPLVSGAAAMLIQAGRRMGVHAAAATEPRTIKALLLNGAAKPSGWSHSTKVPLDPVSGAGVLNVFTSYLQLEGGNTPLRRERRPRLRRGIRRSKRGLP